METTIPAEHCKFAVPKKGRLYTQVTDMLSGAGVEYHREPRLDIAICKDLPMTMVFLPAADIPKYVGEGNIDIGVTGIDIVEENGDLEVQRVLDLGFVDLVETGTTMKAAGLEIVQSILNTEAVIISNPQSPHKAMIDLLKHRIEGYITSKKFVMVTYNCSPEILDKVSMITPGKRAPTITQLTDGGHSVSSLVKKGDVVKVMDELHLVGARDILVLELSNSRM
eukprot:scaffold62487_cov47-Cyclotella_meneghiniana.AAC.5